MAAPELVIAQTPFKSYPGGILALPAKDWMGPARGSLSTEVDARALNASGRVVRETQKVTTTMDINFDTAAFGAADDTFVINLSTLPIVPNMQYLIGMSFLVEGDWDVTNPLSRNLVENWSFRQSARCSFFGIPFYSPTESSPMDGPLYIPRKLDYYSTVIFNDTTQNTNIVGQTLRIRAYGITGTTIEWLIDQIYFFPYFPFGHSSDHEWTLDDFNLVDGDWPDNSVIEFGAEWVDGADGGDELGKFTLQPFCEATHDNITFTSAGGGDYQRKTNAASAEYTSRVVAHHFFPDDGAYYDSDFLALTNSKKHFPNNEAPAHCYGFHGAYYIPEQDWINDTFSRTVGDGNFSGADNHFVGVSWSDTPEGFTWGVPLNWEPLGPFDDPNFAPGTYRSGKALYLDGSKAIMDIKRYADGDFSTQTGNLACSLQGFGTGLPTPSSSRGAFIDADNLAVSGTFTADANAFVVGPNNVGINLGNFTSPTYQLVFDCELRKYKFVFGGTGPGIDLIPSTSLAWWVGTAKVGWRIEVARYRLRARVWDASGAEPSTWDYDGFRPLRIFPSTYQTYPYREPYHSGYAWEVSDTFSFSIFASTSVHEGTDPETIRVEWDNIVIKNQLLGGEITPTHYYCEQPDHGVEVGEIEIPVGSQAIVYWGTRDWTTVWPGDWYYLDFAIKAWNETTAGPLQRAEVQAIYFKSQRSGTLIPIHWHHGHPANKIVLRP